MCYLTLGEVNGPKNVEESRLIMELVVDVKGTLI